MGKRAAAACRPPQISQRPRRRRKTTPDDVAAGSDLGSSSTTERARIWQPTTPDDAAPGLSSCSATPQAEGRPRQGKKPNTAQGLRSCASATASATAQVRPLRTLSLSWGTKRLRTGSALGSRWRDWAGLDEGPAALIAERVLANDVADYVRFRAVCLLWRRCCADPRARGVLEDPRFYPRQWIMLRDDYEKLAAAAAPHGIRRRFLNIRIGQCIQADIPELCDHGIFRATAEGFLVMHCKHTQAVRLLNPLTRQMAQLPRTTGLVEFTLRCFGECTPCCAGLLYHTTVYMYGRFTGTMAIAQPGDDRWVLLNTGRELMHSTVFFAGRFYGLTASGIVTVDMAGGIGPRLVVAAGRPKPFKFSSMTDTVHLVDNGDGDLRLVHRMQRKVRVSDDHYTDKMMYRVYRVNFSSGKTTNRGRRNLGGRAIFIDRYGGLSVSPRTFSFLSGDAIYLGLHCDERGAGYGEIGVYHVRDGTIEPPGNDDSQRRRLAHPLSIADSLIAYVSC